MVVLDDNANMAVSARLSQAKRDNSSAETRPTINQISVEHILKSSMKKRSKPHGNIKLQRFKRRWRKRGLTEEQIKELSIKRQTGDPMESEQEPNHTTMKTLSKKRKRCQVDNEHANELTKSLSQISISRRSKRKRQNEDQSTVTNKDRRLSKYLSMPKKLLYRSLRLQLNHPLKKAKERHFIMSRVKLLDQMFCLKQDIKLHQSYLDNTEQSNRCPNDISVIVQTNEHSSVKAWLQNKVNELHQQLDVYANQLLLQVTSCPKGFSVDNIDNRLNEFVKLHHLDLMRKVNYHIHSFKDDIQLKELDVQLNSYSLTDDQKQSIHILVTVRQKQLQVLEEMIMFETRILCKRLPKFINDVDKWMPKDSNSSSSQHERAKMHRKQIRDYKRQLLVDTLAKFEDSIEENEHEFQKELFRFEYELCQHSRDSNDILSSLTNYLNHYTDKMIRHIHYKESIFRHKLRHPRRHRPKTTSKASKQCISVYPETILEIPENDLFNENELSLLSSTGGPSYIRYNQSYLYRNKKNHEYTDREVDDIIKKVLSGLLNRYRMPSKSIEMQNFTNQLKSLFNERYEDSLSYLDKYHIRREIKLVHSIRRKLHRTKHVLRVTDKSGVFHIGTSTDYERKVLEYQLRTNAYVELSSNPLMETYDKVIRLLNDLRSKNQILQWQYSKMVPDKNKLKLAYLYFIPKPHKEGTPLRPIISGMKSSTINISKMLDRSIRPLFDEYAQQTTIIDGEHLIRRLQQYVSLGLLKPTTHLCTFDITDLYTMLPQEESIAILKKFLLQFGHRHVKGMTLEAIERLARIVLTENVFIYNDKYYRQVKGGAMGSPFTLTLANIFMWHWEKLLVDHQRSSNELYGRYIDDIFLTSNESIEKFRQLLIKANNYHPAIRLNYEISDCVSFLDLKITNLNGQLETSMYHKAAAEPYILPFTSDHPHHTFQNIISTRIERAFRYCSTLSSFKHEVRCIKLMLLYTGYPIRFIRRHFYRSLETLSLTISAISPIISDDIKYHSVRQEHLGGPSRFQHIRAFRIASQLDESKRLACSDPLIAFHYDAKERKKTLDRLIMHYTYEKRFAYYKPMLHRIWRNAFEKTPILSTRLIVGTRNHKNLSRELIRRAPYQPPTVIKRRRTTGTNLADEENRLIQRKKYKPKVRNRRLFELQKQQTNRTAP